MHCGVNGCHGAQTPGMEDLIDVAFTGIDTVMGYVPDSTYDIKVSLKRNGIDRYGFEIVAEDASKNAVGTFTGNSRVTSYVANRRATHKDVSIDSSGENGWEMRWKAPAQGTGTIRFYAAVLAANGNGNNQGDTVWLGSVKADELVNIPGSVSDLDRTMHVYPNPCDAVLMTETNGVPIDGLQLIGMDGSSFALDPMARTHDLSGLASGTYILEIRRGEERFSRRILRR